MKLLNIGNNAKTVKGDGEYITAVLYLAPDRNHTVPGDSRTLCPSATKGCSKACLYTAGRGQFDSVKASRIRKANYFLENRENFLKQLKLEVASHVRRCAKLGVKPAVRLNGTSDVAWEKLKYHWSDKYPGFNIFQIFPDVQFYDYTKVLPRLRKKLPVNYCLTFSRSEATRDATVKRVVKEGHNVAVVFSSLPKSYLGIPVIDGDADDLRFLDPSGVIVGLTPKGQAKKDTSGFLVEVA